MRLLPLTLLAAVALSAGAPTVQAASGIEHEIVVLRRGGLTGGERSDARVRAERRIPIAGVELVSARGPRAAALASLRADPDVEWAEPNRLRRVSADPLAGYLWGLENNGSSPWNGTPDADIDASAAWLTSRGAGVTVAVVDTGVDTRHPDVAGRLVPGYDFVERDSIVTDGHGHGTHVTGTIAASENSVGVVGVAPAARVMPLRVLNSSGEGSTFAVAEAFAYAGSRGVRVVNASLGSNSASAAERAAIKKYPGTLFVVAAGNGGADNDGGATEYPCAYPEPNVICVGASNPDDARAGFSNFGAATVDLFAPGEVIVSTYPLGKPTELGDHFPTGDGYEALSGTSMAAPHVAGAAALALALRPAWTTARVKAALLERIDRPLALAGSSVSGGRLNAAATVRLAAASAVAEPPAPVPAAAAIRAQQPIADVLAPAAAPRISRLRIRVRRRAHTATLSFRLAAEADVVLRLERKRCARGRCDWRLAGRRSRHTAAGTARWLVGPRVGLPIARGNWRVTLATTAGSARRRFAVH